MQRHKSTLIRGFELQVLTSFIYPRINEFLDAIKNRGADGKECNTVATLAHLDLEDTGMLSQGPLPLSASGNTLKFLSSPKRMMSSNLNFREYVLSAILFFKIKLTLMPTANGSTSIILL